MGGFRITELLIVLGIVVILFGVGRIGKIGSELGAGIKGFKDSLQGKDEEEDEINKEKTTDIK
ncbi:MAG: twin-arginine translocase TatA/TatE family subunit [Anaerolineaceae bacterium]|nr:twin-arginine translocase TatA/TatE family subunit [Anaerolineaceae bacterium]